MSRRPQIVRVYTENVAFQHFETLLRNRKKRIRHREFLIEGVRHINLVRDSRWTVNGWLYAPDAKLSRWAQEVLSHHPAPTHYELSVPLLAKLSAKQEASELLALVAMPDDDLKRIPLHPSLLVLIFDRPASPGNLGTLIRSCDALGVDGLIISGHAVDLYDAETISASLGTLFTLPVVRLSSPQELEPWLAKIQSEFGSFQLIGSSAQAETLIDEQSWLVPTVLVIGNETRGMSTHFHTRCDTIVKIPINGAATSLNVACAASILLYEIQRQRNANYV